MPFIPFDINEAVELAELLPSRFLLGFTGGERLFSSAEARRRGERNSDECRRRRR